VRKNLTTIVFISGIVSIFFFLIFHLHQTSREKVLSQFNEYQLLATQQVAKSVEKYFFSRSQDLESLINLSSQQAFDRDKMELSIQSNFHRLQEANVAEVSLLNEKGAVVFSTTTGSTRKNHFQADLFDWARNPGNKGAVKMWWEKMEGPCLPGTPGSAAFPHIEVFLASPLYRQTAAGAQQRPGEKFAGLLVFRVDLEKILIERWPLLNPATKSHKLWVMEQGGLLLLHSEHPEMVMRNIRKMDKTCHGCHTSLDYIQRVLGKNEGVIEYQIKGYNRKLAAFTLLSFENLSVKTSWIIVMTAPLDEVTAFEGESFKDTLLLIACVVLLLCLAFFIAYRNYRLRMATEMEVKRQQGYQVLMEKLRNTLRGTIQVISRAVEMKDPYTAGHQRRSADLARAIATEMGLSADRRDFVRIACAIHDIGKISIPAEILAKTTTLNDLEFNLIKTHAQAGYEILKDVEFPWPVADVILQHHERLDGSGYPLGVKGKELLLEARIIAVADVVESMVSHRPYRPALGIEAALEEITLNRDTLYDPKVVDACLKLFREKGYKMVD